MRLGFLDFMSNKWLNKSLAWCNWSDSIYAIIRLMIWGHIGSLELYFKLYVPGWQLLHNPSEFIYSPGMHFIW